MIKLFGGVLLGAVLDYCVQKWYAAQGTLTELLGPDNIAKLKLAGVTPIRLSDLIGGLSAQEVAETVLGRKTVYQLFPFVVFVRSNQISEEVK